MRKATAISTGLHAAVLLWALLSFSGKTFEVTPAESLPVDLISEKDFSRDDQGVKDAPKVETPKPLVEKRRTTAEAGRRDSNAQGHREERSCKPSKEIAPPPEPQPPKPDPIAEKLKKKDEPKQDARPSRSRCRRRSRRRSNSRNSTPTRSRRCSTSAIRSATPRPAWSSSDALARHRHRHGRPAVASEIDALRARLMALWNPPVGVQDAERLNVMIRIRFKPDGTSGAPARR